MSHSTRYRFHENPEPCSTPTLRVSGEITPKAAKTFAKAAAQRDVTIPTLVSEVLETLGEDPVLLENVIDD